MRLRNLHRKNAIVLSCLQIARRVGDANYADCIFCGEIAWEYSMKGLLIRVVADQSDGGGKWNGPVDSETGRFVYVPIPETKPNRFGHERPYTELNAALRALGVILPTQLASKRMHLDPDFEHLTYGDRGAKGKQIENGLGRHFG